MARINKHQTLSIVIPSFNEANHLPLLIADLKRWPCLLEICVCDSCSSDLTAFIAELAGAKLLTLPEPCRGAQLHHGACHTKGEWLLFLHADCRIPANWPKVLEKIIYKSSSKNFAWFFDFKIQGDKIGTSLMELAVNLRSNLFQRPYGDQGLLINRSLYKQVGGYKPIYLMEDLDLIQRLSKQTRIRSLGLPIYSDGRRWEDVSFVAKALENAQLRRRWKQGESSKSLADRYYRNRI